MATVYHLYDPQGGTAYRNKVSDPNHPKPVGMEWREGLPPANAPAYKEKSKVDQARDALAALPAEMRAKYYTAITNIRTAIENDEWEVVPLLLAGIQTETPEEADALQQISNLLGG